MDDACAAFGPVARPLGVLAVAAGRYDDASSHFEHAVELARRWRAPGWELAAITDWLQSDVSPAGSGARATAGSRSPANSSLPWIAASLRQTTTP